MESDVQELCRICRSGEDSKKLIRPCNCKGTIKYVHAFCLQNWIAISSRLNCEICTSGYRGRKVCKYGLFASVLPYLRARWRQPKINFSLLFTYYLLEQVFLEAKDCYYKSGRYRRASSAMCQLFASMILWWLKLIVNPRRLILATMALQDWISWRQTQVIFTLECNNP